MKYYVERNQTVGWTKGRWISAATEIYVIRTCIYNNKSRPAVERNVLRMWVYQVQSKINTQQLATKIFQNFVLFALNTAHIFAFLLIF